VAGVVLLFVAAALWLLRPLPRLAGTHSIETCDSLFIAWVYSWDLHALLTPGKSFFHANAFHPMKKALALGDHMVGNVPLFAPAMLVTGNPLLGTNVVIIVSFVLSGLSMTWLVHYYTRRLGPSVAAGFVYAFVPFRFSQLSHHHLLSLQWLPVAVYFGDRLLREGGRRAWLGFTAFTLWQCLVSYYLAYLTAVVLGAYGAVAAWRLRAERPGRRVLAYGLGLASVAAVMVPLTLPYARLQREGIIPRFTRADLLNVDATAMALADPVRSYLSVPPTSPYRRLLPFNSRHLDSEKTLFPGFVPLVTIVAAAGAVRLGRRAVPSSVPRGVPAALGTVLAATFVLSLGPWLVWNDERTSIPLPAYWLAVSVPGFSGIRAWSRFGFGVVFALSALFGLALARLTVRATPRRRGLVAAGAIGLLAVEYDTAPLHLSAIPPVRTPASAWLAERASEGGALLVLPNYVHPCERARYMYHSTVHWLPLANAYSGHLPPVLAETNELAERLPDPLALRQARNRGIRWLLLERDGLAAPQRAAFEAATREGRLRPAATFPNEIVFDLRDGAAKARRRSGRG
jgi:hypothetical protein